MPAASFVQTSFLGGELSKFAQGRYDREDYRTCMAICFNGHPIETGAWTRRSGTQFAGTTRVGYPAKVVKFDFSKVSPYTIEFSYNTLRFRKGTQFATTNDTVGVLSISTATPPVLQTSAAVNWVTGQFLFVTGSKNPKISNRQFYVTKVDITHFSLADGITLTDIDGSTLGAIDPGATVSRIQEIFTPWTKASWDDIRVIQAEKSAVVLDSVTPPQILQVTTLPTSTLDAQFKLSTLTFLDGPYLDPFTNGVQVTPNAKSGNITLTLAFPAWSATQAYKKGDFVTSSSVNYISIQDNNVNFTPVSSGTFWTPTSAGAAINDGAGFLASDVGRLVRLLSEPLPWAAGTAYAAGNVVSYNPDGDALNALYWTALGSTTGNVPGTDTTHWSLTPSNAAIWSWGKIISLTTQISGTIAGGANIGDMTANGGLAAAFDGVTVKASGTAASLTSFLAVAPGYVGKNYTGASAQTIGSAIVYPTVDLGFTFGPGGDSSLVSVTVNLRAKSSAPASSSDGTLLATTSPIWNTTSPITLISNDTTTAWNYVWIELIVTRTVLSDVLYIAQVQFFSASSSSTGNGVVIELLGAPLLYTNPIITWRLGVYSGTTGYPICGCWHEGRLWLAGAVENRFDASVSNGLLGSAVNFAPTDHNGIVAASNAISYTVNSDGVNPITSMTPDLQGIICGTLAGELLISPPTPGSISPTNIATRRVTTIGHAHINPVRTEHTMVFVQRFSQKIMEYFSDVYSGKFSAPNLSRSAMHITTGVRELAWIQAVLPSIWGRNSDGSWFGITYKRDTLSTSTGPTFSGFHRHSLGSGRIVESICAGPSVGGSLDAVTMVTNDTATQTHHVEVMTDLVEEDSTLAQAMYLDDAINPASTTSHTMNPPPYGGLIIEGLWPFNGKTVQAWIGGVDCGLQEDGTFVDFVVTNGSITIPYGDGISAGSGAGQFTAALAAATPLSQMWIGFTYTSQGQIVRPHAPAESGARTGPAFGKKRRAEEMAVQVEGTNGVSFGTRFDRLFPLKFDAAEDGVPLPLTQQATGIYGLNKPDDTYSYDGMICWQITRPYPCNIVAIGPMLSTQDK